MKWRVPVGSEQQGIEPIFDGGIYYPAVLAQIRYQDTGKHFSATVIVIEKYRSVKAIPYCCLYT